MSIFTIFMAFVVLFVVGLTWFVVYYFANPVLENPDGIAKVVGNCGDTMEIGFAIQDGRVAATHYWTNDLFPSSSQRGGRLFSFLHRDQLDIKVEHGIGADGAAAFFAVGQLGGNENLPFAAFLHQLQRFGPALDDGIHG